MSNYVLGIDLGTTNCCVAIMEGDAPKVIEQKGGYRTLPSIVAFGRTDPPMIGHIAKRQAVTNPERTIYGVKRFIGRDFNSTEVKRAMESVTYKIVEGLDKDPRILVQDKQYPVPEISAFLLKQIKSIAEAYLQEPVNKAVITVPAYFNDGQRQATKDAGIIAGLEVLRIVNEPTAAALAFGYDRNLNKKIVVYDLGGGTFDVSVLEISGETFEVLATAGNTYLGGEDFDKLLADFINKSFIQEHGFDLRKDKMAMQRLRDAAESAKCQLSTVLETEINMPFITTVEGESKHLKLKMPRIELERLADDLVNQTLQICEETLKMADVKVREIDDVLLVGGMSRMPLVQIKVHDFFGKIPAKNVHPDEAIALGAAILGSTLQEDDNPVLLLDVTPFSLGIKTAGGFTKPLIKRNSTIPIEASNVFTTVKDDQTAVKIQVLQGESKNSSENTFLGEFTLTGIKPAKAGTPQIDVTFAIDSDGIVHVSAKDLDTGKEQSIIVTIRSMLTDEEREDLRNKMSSNDLELEPSHDSSSTA